LSDLPFEIVSMQDAGITVDVVEDGKTFEENAVKKALEISKVSGNITLADDSGLEIDFLNKQPGVLSARYLGENTPYIEKNNHILHLMKDVPEKQRTARFVCAIAAVFPNGKVLTAIDTIEGIIAQTLFIASAMPTSVNSSVIAQEYDNYPELAAELVFLSTLLSSITVVVVIYASKLLF